MKLEAVAIVQAAVMASPFSVEEIAAHLDLRPSTLYAKLNPYPNPDHRHILGLEEAIAICRFVGDGSLAEHVASMFDVAVPDGQSMDEECLQGFQALSALVGGIKARAPYTELIRLFASACKELKDIIKRARAEQSKGRRAA
jgi:DNA-binding transcriptional ArsR family regulator